MKSLKRFIAVFMCVVLTLTAAPLQGFVGLDLPSLFAKAAEASDIVCSGTCGDNLMWSLDTISGVLTISGTGDMYNYDYYGNNFAPWYSSRYYIKSVSVGNDVTSIGDSAFTDCYYISNVTIGEAVEVIGAYAFDYCSKLVNISIPAGVTSIGWSAFGACPKLSRITVDSDNDYYSSDSYGVLFNKDKTVLLRYPSGNSRTSYIIPFGVITIDSVSFYSASNLSTILVPNTVTCISNQAFLNCSSLTEVNYIGTNDTWNEILINDGNEDLTQASINFVSIEVLDSGSCGENLIWTVYDNGELIISGSGSIPDYSYTLDAPWYSHKDIIKKVIIEDGVTAVGDLSFYGYSSIESITVSGSVTDIGAEAFRWCTGLEYFEVDLSNGYYSNDSIGALFNKDKTKIILFPNSNSNTSYSIPDSVLTIGNYAFFHCEKLAALSIPNSVDTIEDWAISHCYSLTELIIPNSVKTIGERAFFADNELKTIAIPSNVISIGSSAFSHCKSLEKIDVESTNEYYSSDEYGVLFNGNKTELIQYPLGTTRKNYEIPQGVNTISENAFSLCEKITSVTIPNSLKNVLNDAFWKCSALTDVYYNGTQEEWNLISIDESNTSLLSATIHFLNEEEPTTEEWTTEEYTTEESTTEEDVTQDYIDEENKEYSGTCGKNLMWSFDKYTGVLTISGTGEMKDYGEWIPEDYTYTFIDRPWAKYAEQITCVEICSGVTHIGSFAFLELLKVETVSLPETVLEIGSGAFAACTSLTGFTVDENNPLFMADEDGVLYGRQDMDEMPEQYRNEKYEYALVLFNYPIGNGVREYTVAENVYAVGDYAFACCPTLEKITFPQTYMSLGNAVLANCPKLRTVTLNPLKLMNIGDNNYDWIEQCPEIIYDIEADCGKNVKSKLVMNIKALNGTLTISGTGAVYDYLDDTPPWYELSEGITEIIIEDGVTAIGDYAFYGCRNLTSITIPESVTSIGYRAFGYCDNLFDVYYGSSMEDWEKIAIDERNESLFSATIHTYECEHIVDQFSWETVKEATCTPGLEIATCSICGMRGGEKTVVCDSSTYPESAHNYDNNADQIWDFSYTGAKKLILNFSASTATERGYDYIYLYDGNGSLIGEYCGTQLSGKKIIIEGSSFRIRLMSDGSVTEYGFSFDSVSARVDNELNRVIPAVAEHDWSGKDGVCANGCGTECAHVTNEHGVCDVCGRSCAELGHVFQFGKCSVCGKTGGTCGENLTWVIDENTGTLIICGTGEMDAYTGYDAPWYKFRESITEVIVEDGVVSIGDYAFRNCCNIENAIISACVTTINEKAFGGEFSKLKKVTFGENSKLTTIGNEAFSYCEIDSITIPENVTAIGTGAFLGCQSLTEINVEEANEVYCSVDGVLYNKDKTVLVRYPAGKADKEFTISDTVKEIGAYAFAWCYNLETLTIPDSVTTIGSHAFYGSEFTIVSSFGGLTEIGDYAFAHCDFTAFDIPDGVETIGNYAFYGCYNLQNITIPDSVTVIGSLAFSDCTNLTSVTIPDSVVAIGKGAFVYCVSLIKAEIGSGLKRIPQNMFESCYNLAEVEISEGVTDIGDYAFYYCDSLKTINIPASVTTIGTEAFDSCESLEGFEVSADNGSFCSGNGVLFNKNKTALLRYPTGKTARSYTIPSTVTEIVPYAFSGAANLRQITIPAMVTTIGGYAFSYSGLISVELENGITVIGEDAFANCIKLQSVSIPATITRIETNAFYRCHNLTDVYHYSIPANWNEIEIGYNNYCLTDQATIHYVTIQAEDYEFINGELIVTGDRVVTTRFSKLDFAQDITKITVKGEVEQIMELAFADLPNVTEVNIAKTVSSIGNFAFENCPKLKTVNLDVEFEEEYEEEETTEEPVCEISEENSDWDIAYNGEIVPNAEAEDNVTTTTRAYTTTTKPPTTTTAPTTTVAPTTTTQEDTQEYTTIIRDERPTTTRPYEEPEEDEYPSYRTIGIMSFAGCESLENIVIPETFKTIGNYAFVDCTKLNSVTLNDGLKNIGSAAFNNCTSLSEITIPVSTQEMGYDAFYGCSSLETVYYNAVNCDITSASDDEKLVFGERDSLKNFYFGEKVHTIPYQILKGSTSITEIVIPDNVTYISSQAFEQCSALTKAVIGSGVEDMGSFVFRDCDALTYVTICDGVIEIGDLAFSDCDSLISVTIPDSVAEIGIQAFSFCDSLKNVIIGKGLTYLRDYGGDWYSGHAFLGCLSLVNIVVDEDNESFTISDDGVLFSKDGTELVCYPIGKTNITYSIPDGVTTIKRGSFYECQNLTSIGIPTSVETIREFALLMGDNLTDVYYAGTEEQWNEIWGHYDALPDSTTLHFNSTVPDTDIASGTCGDNLTWTLDANGKLTIGGTGEMDDFEDGTEPWYRFKSSILQVVVEEGVTTIGDGAFFACVNLKGVELGTDVKNIGWSAFSYCESLENVIVPKSVTVVGRWAFSNCTSLTDVYYSGTEEQWNIISFDAYNEALTSATIHFNGENSATEVDSGTCGDNLTWVIYDDGSLVIEGTGDMYNYTYLGQTPWAEYNDRIVEITIGEGVTSVGIGAFYSCSAVKSISLPSTVYNIRLFAFGACTALEAINVSTDNALFCSEDGVVYNKDKSMLVRYPAGKTATSFDIPESVQTIGNEAFSDSVYLETVSIPKSVKKIEYHAFYGLQALKTVEIPAGVETIGNNVFDACYSLEAINVSADNSTYSSTNGVLFNKTRTELIYYPAAKGTTYTIPDGVKTIKENAFLFSNVNTFVIPTSVIVIEAAQCKYGSANKTVHYAGTKAEWNKISIDSSEGLNDALINANVHFEGEKIEYETSNCKISIKRPKVNEVNYGDVLIFEAVTNDLPEGAKVVWSVSGDVSSKPIISNDGMNCEVYAKGKGEIKVTATVVNAEGVPYQNVNGNIIKAQKSFTVKAGFREIFIWILKSLFGLTTVYTPETFL